MGSMGENKENNLSDFLTLLLGYLCCCCRWGKGSPWPWRVNPARTQNISVTRPTQSVYRPKANVSSASAWQPQATMHKLKTHTPNVFDIMYRNINTSAKCPARQTARGRTSNHHPAQEDRINFRGMTVAVSPGLSYPSHLHDLLNFKFLHSPDLGGRPMALCTDLNRAIRVGSPNDWWSKKWGFNKPLPKLCVTGPMERRPVTCEATSG